MKGRIPQNFIDDLLDRVDIVEIIDKRVKLKKGGRNYMACCPFHDEKTPSFSVNGEKQFYHCFGCGAGGNAIGFLMDYERMEFPQAVEALATHVGLEVPREELSPQQQQEQQKRTTLYDVLMQAAKFFQYQLRNHPEAEKAVDYLRNRGLTGEIARDYGIGFAPPGWDNLIKHFGEDKIPMLEEAGLVKHHPQKNSHYDGFRNRIMYPIRDVRGRVIAFGGRIIDPEDKPKYLNSPETPVFHKNRELYGLYEARKAYKSLERVIIVEGYMDVVALAQYGIRFATATLGTATSQSHLEKIFRQCPEVIFCFDGDKAGRAAALKALEISLGLANDERKAKFLFLPEGEDPDTLIRSQGKDLFLGMLDDKTLSLSEYVFEEAGRGLSDSLEDKARMSSRALAMIQKLPESTFKQLMMDELGNRTGLSAEQLQKQVPEPVFEEEAPMSFEIQGEQPLHREQHVIVEPEQHPNKLSQHALQVLLNKPEIAEKVLEFRQTLEKLQDYDSKLLLEVAEKAHREQHGRLHLLLMHWHGTTQGEYLTELLSRPMIGDSEVREMVLKDTLNKLQSQVLKQSQKQLLEKLRSIPTSELTDEQKEQLRQLAQSDSKRSK